MTNEIKVVIFGIGPTGERIAKVVLEKKGMKIVAAVDIARIKWGSGCEEFAYPWLAKPQLASQIDGLAKRHGVTVLSTGINPGYFMDTFPLVLT